ncbi:addiction module protein [Chitinophaga sp. CC14]|uniref:addiction module protein n=1 Tax=Chitinophaga sp. CC14 TaxID=3029199 RepID=UPI003B81504D
MGATAIREKLHDYIRFADDKKVKAIYTMVEDEINHVYDPLEDPQYLDMLDRRIEEYESGKVKGSSWNEVETRILASKKR